MFSRTCMKQDSKNPERGEFAVAVVFVVSDEAAPPEGNLVGDVLYVPVPEGYHNIVLKTKAMLRLVRFVHPPAVSLSKEIRISVGYMYIMKFLLISEFDTTYEADGL